MVAYGDLGRVFLATVVSVDYNTGVCRLSFLRPNDQSTNTIVAQPYAGRGWGMFFGVEPGTLCVCGMDSDRKIYIVSYFPDTVWYSPNLQQVNSAGIDEFNYPRVVSGEVVLQSKKNAHLALNRYGDVLLETPTGVRLLLDATTDTLEMASAQTHITCEAYRTVSGVIKRDIRTLEERQEEPLSGSGSAFGYNLDETTELIGFDPTFKPEAAPALSDDLLSGVPEEGFSSNLRAQIQSSFSTLPSGIADLSLGDSGSSLYRSDAVNPPLTEIRETFYEFGDSNVGIDLQNVSDDLKAVGKFGGNVLGRKVIGTAVNEIGKILSFDYGFDDGSVGHGLLWNTEGIDAHADGRSTDDYFDRENTLKLPKGEIREDFEWTVETLERTDAATMFDFTLRTRGVNHLGEPELEDTGGVNWFCRIAKDGLTKLNIPAATSLNANEFHREGRSVLANLAGSLEMSIGKQLCTKDKGLDRIAGSNDDRANFVNMNDYPNYGRKDRSVALDLEGNLEALIGGDSNTNQSVMVQADGSLAAFFGKEIVSGAGNGQIDPLAAESGAPISTACLARDRRDRSITIRTLGNVEAHFNKDRAYGQSMMITTEGGNRSMWGADNRGRSWDVQTTGGIRVEVQGPMSKQGYALEIDLEGNMHVYVNGKVDFHSTDDMRFQTEKDFHLDVGGDFLAKIGGDSNLSVQGSRKDSITGDDSLSVQGSKKTAVSGSEGVSVQGSRDISVSGSASDTTSGPKSIQGSGGVNIDGGAINLNTGGSVAASPDRPDRPATPKDIFRSSRETETIPLDISTEQSLPEPRQSDQTGEPPVTEQLQETIDPKTNRIVNPFDEGNG